MVDRLRRFQAEHRGLANSRQAFDAKRASDPAFAAEIETLYNRFVGTFRRYCGNCWHDAFIQLLTIKNMNSKSQFRVLAGTLLHDPVNRDVRYMLTPQRLAEQGDELALRHLANNPRAIEYFEKPLPENLDKLIADYRKRQDAPAEEAADAEKTTGPKRRGSRNSGRGAQADTESTKPAEEAAPSPEPEVPAPAEEAAPETAQDAEEAYEDIPSSQQ